MVPAYAGSLVSLNPNAPLFTPPQASNAKGIAPARKKAKQKSTPISAERSEIDALKIEINVV